ncbi:MAG: hypothetical protein RLZZ385_2798 [Pseudomonadota bacterium]|jgi:formylglycine-generating enzyme required for sulfatase activity
MSEGPAVAGGGSGPSKGTRFGFAALAVLTLFVAVWMAREARLQQSSQSAAVVESPAPVSLPGFRADLMQLPDDELLGFVEIPAGDFLMGSNPAYDRFAFENERWSLSERQGTVTLSNYYIGRFEVTVAQYQVFLQDSARPADERIAGLQPDHPVAFVTWTDALAYSRWLERKLRESNGLPAPLRALLDAGWHVVLPNEAEWEKAARGVNGEIYPWGNRPRRDLANFGSAGTVPVGSIRCDECRYGLSDMSGNVWELTRSPYQNYPYDPYDDHLDLEADALWVMRGGSFLDGEGNVRGAIRGGVDPGVRNATIGFRLALSRI